MAHHKANRFVGFNQDNSCITASTPSGFAIHSSSPLEKQFEFPEIGGVYGIEMLFHSSLVAVVGAGQHPKFPRRRLRLLNTKTRQYICDLNFVTSIIVIKMNKTRLVVVLESKIHIFLLASMKMLHTVDTCSNPQGVFSLSPTHSNCYMAFPASESAGKVLIYDARNLQVVTVIPAHEAPLQVINFNHQGTMISTSSEKGTVIRVFSVPSGRRLWQFRRGSYPIRICSIAFNRCDKLLAVSSTSQTVHIFDIEENEGKRQNYSTSVISGVLPVSWTKHLEPGRDYTQIVVKQMDKKRMTKKCGFLKDSNIVIVLESGIVYQYEIISQTRKCKLVAEGSIVETTSQEIGAKRFHEHSETEEFRESNLVDNLEEELSSMSEHEQSVETNYDFFEAHLIPEYDQSKELFDREKEEFGVTLNDEESLSDDLAEIDRLTQHTDKLTVSINSLSESEDRFIPEIKIQDVHTEQNVHDGDVE